MIPKKLFLTLQYFSEKSDDMLFSDFQSKIDGFTILNPVYVNLPQVWHYNKLDHTLEEPSNDSWILMQCKKGYEAIYWGSYMKITWKEYVLQNEVTEWAYIKELLPYSE